MILLPPIFRVTWCHNPEHSNPNFITVKTSSLT